MAYSPRLWAQVRQDYENGEIQSVEKLSEKYKISAPAINIRREKECWVKNSNKALIQRSVQEQFIEALAKNGCDVDYLAKKVKQLMEATNALVDVNGNEIGERKDWTAIAKGLQEANKILGSYAPQRQEVEVMGMVDKKIDLLRGIIIEFVPDDKHSEIAERIRMSIQ